MIEAGHPYHFLRPLFDIPESVFTFSRYVYTPDSISDEREVIEVSGKDLSADWLGIQLSSLRADQEFAIHSVVRRPRQTRHIPMIDLATNGAMSEAAYDRLRRYLPRKVFRSLSFFRSGRSFHAYARTLLTSKEWIGLMGRLLLVNPRQGDSVVDSRWIGHRLLGGFSSLRVSNNSGKYLAMPTSVSLRELLSSSMAFS